jgi:site-specific DNA-cytosine methylase
VDDGLRKELDAIAAYGNAVVPQVAEWIGRRILEAA